MRQAGRSLPEYRELRKRFNLFEVCRQPELCAEVTLQPVRAHGVDAAVMFADIMLPALGMGVDVELVENVGPVIAEPIESLADVERLRVPEPEEAVPFVLEAVRLVRSVLPAEQAVIGFAGGPFTVAGYLIEGKPTREFLRTKRCMYGSPDVWHALMSKLADTFAAYLRAKVAAGADVVQLFDSWVGALSVEDYREFVALLGARPGCGRRADDPLRHRDGAPARRHGGGRRRRHRARLAGSDRARLGDRRAGEGRRETSTRRCCSGRGSGWRARRKGSWPR